MKFSTRHISIAVGVLAVTLSITLFQNCSSSPNISGTVGEASTTSSRSVVTSTDNASNAIVIEDTATTSTTNTSTTSSTSTNYTRAEITYVSATSEISGWAASNVLSATYSGCYSSTMSTTNQNTTNEGISVWSKDSRQLKLKRIQLHARVLNSKVLGFPVQYKIYMTNANNTGWDLLGEFTNQPSATDGLVTIDLTTAKYTFGIWIQPMTFGADDYGNYYFQLVGIDLME